MEDNGIDKGVTTRNRNPEFQNVNCYEIFDIFTVNSYF